VRLLVVECQSDLRLRATAQHDGLAHLGAAPTLRALTAGGRCVLTLDPGPGRQSYQSAVPLEGLGVAELLERYMARSEQLDTRFVLAANQHRAAGLLLQRLPDHGGHAHPREDADLWERSGHLARTLTAPELLGLPADEILRRLFHQETLRVFESLPVRFACRCSRGRVAGLIRMLGPEEARAVLAEQGHVSVTCDFCAETYVFDPGQAEAALADRQAQTPSQV
jgi:molecular chaperone Hsp33